ncbi:MAG: hypothetical protein D3920_00880 [Candidatus Electrothrix sp. AW2]|nr:hypothetical protein [Candidatus Electrothrix gigas]
MMMVCQTAAMVTLIVLIPMETVNITAVMMIPVRIPMMMVPRMSVMPVLTTLTFHNKKFVNTLLRLIATI